MGEILKGGFKQGDVVKIFSSHVGVFGSTDKEMPEGVPDNFLFVYEANNKYMMLGDEKRLYGEYEYKRLYDDLLANKEEWLEFFRYLANAQYCGDCFKVLEPLQKFSSSGESMRGVVKFLTCMQNFCIFTYNTRLPSMMTISQILRGVCIWNTVPTCCVLI
jgi:hypothetical protein